MGEREGEKFRTWGLGRSQTRGWVWVLWQTEGRGWSLQVRGEGEYCRRGRRRALPTVQFCLGQLIACAQKIASGSLGQYAIGFPWSLLYQVKLKFGGRIEGSGGCVWKNSWAEEKGKGREGVGGRDEKPKVTCYLSNTSLMMRDGVWTLEDLKSFDVIYLFQCEAT